MNMPSKAGANEVRFGSRRLLERYDPALDEADRQPLLSYARTHWRALAAWGLAAALVFAFLVWAVWFAPSYFAPGPTDADLAPLKDTKPDVYVKALTDRATAQNAVRTTLIGAIAGAAFLTTGFFAWRQVTLSRLGQLTDRFTKCIENLGAESSAVRLAGVYGLEQLSADHRFRRPAAQVLAAFIRDASPLKADSQTSEAPPKARSEAGAPRARRLVPRRAEERVPREVQECATILISKGLWRRATSSPINLAGAELPQINLPGTDLRGALLYEANLRSADLRGTDLSHADLRDADLTGAYMLGAKLDGARLQGAILASARLDNATGVGVRFDHTDLRDAELGGAQLARANFTDANLAGLRAGSSTLTYAQFGAEEGSRGHGADLTGALFTGAKLTGADFTGAEVDKVASWDRAVVDATTGLPQAVLDRIDPRQSNSLDVSR
jgi:uncharacterized protein YjbI with pentapeptide repeats